MYALTPLDRVRGRVNVIRSLELPALLQNNVPYEKKLIGLVGYREKGETDLFYVNRFQCDSDATVDTNSVTWTSVDAIRNGEESVSII